ncbi:hypothetical protein ACN47E_008853 [Coniothyrium glycines]
MDRHSRSAMPFRSYGNRDGASPRGGSSQRTASSLRPGLTAPKPGIPCVQPRGGPFPDSTSSDAPCEASASEIEQELADGHDDTLNEVIMSIDLTPRGSVGCCYYVAREEILYFMEDIQFGDVDVVDSLRLLADPTVILISTKIDDSVVDRFDPGSKNGASINGDNDQFRLPFLLEVRPPSEFSYVTAKSKLVGLRLGQQDGVQINFHVPGEFATAHQFDDDNTTSQQGQLLRLAGWIDLESRITVGCAGALISYLQRRRAAAYLPGDHNAQLMFRISTLKMFTLRETMFVNADTLHSLQIMDAESHPHSHNRGPTKASSGAKEGLSVYGLFHHFARTSQGRFMLRQYFLRPCLDMDVVNGRLNTLSVLTRPDNDAALHTLTNSLKNVGNMRVMLIHLKKGVRGATKGSGVSRSSWTSIRAFAFHALQIKDTLQEIIGGEGLAIKAKVFNEFESYHLAQIGRKINQTVDFEQSAEESRTVILPGIDEELDAMKRTLDGLDSLLNEVAKKLSEKMPSSLRADLNVIYFPQIGFLVTVPVDPTLGTAVYEGNVDNRWERLFSTEEQIYFRSSETREMDDHFGDVYGMISDREIEISHELAQFVLHYEELLTTCSDICGELDSLLALAQGAKKYNLCRPQMTLDNVVHINGGRHILLELSVSSFVPNDTHLVGGAGSDHGVAISHNDLETTAQFITSSSARLDRRSKDGPSMLVLTGPNYSGKSVYLKQVALIVFMAHVGSFVPAESARIGLTDKILSRVTARESVSRSQSAFMIDLHQMSLALSLATRRSLLIIDEFGKGTESSDGAGLACAVMEHLLNLGADSPKVIGATHFHEIFEMGFLQPQPSLAFGHMEVRLDADASESVDQISYLYNFRAGRSNCSFGTCCASINGVPAEIVRRAEDLVLMSIKGEDLVSACCLIPEHELMELEQAEQIARSFLEADVHKDPKTTLANILRPFTMSNHVNNTRL